MFCFFVGVVIVLVLGVGVISKGSFDCGKHRKGNSRKARFPSYNVTLPAWTHPAFQGEEDLPGDYSMRSTPQLGSPYLRAASGGSWKLLTGFDLL